MKTDLSCARKYDYYLFDLSRNRAKACCKSPFDSKVTSFEEDLNTILRDRRDLKNGQQVSSCKACWALEHQGAKSFRSIVPFGDGISSLETHRPYIVELLIGNRCNLRCVYCGPDSSSRWGPSKSLLPSASSIQISSEVEGFLRSKWAGIGRVCLVGGEPMMIPGLFDVMALLGKIASEQETKRRIKVKIVSNFSIPSKQFRIFIDRLVEFQISMDIELGVSAESLDRRFEYIRDGALSAVFKDNLAYAIRKPSIEICLQSTLSLLSIAKFHEFLEFYINELLIVGKKIDLKYNEVVSPSQLSPRNFPFPLEKERLLVQNLLMKVQEDDIRWSRSYKNFCDSIDLLYQSLGSKTPIDSFRFLDQSELRRVRSMNWRETFPELNIT
jgi:organic radical activating enzyme